MAGSSVGGTLSSMITTVGGKTDVGDNAGQHPTVGSGVKSGGGAQRGMQTPMQTPLGAQTPARAPSMKAPQTGKRLPPSQTNQPKKFSSANPPLGTPTPAAPHPGVLPPYPDARSPQPTLMPNGVPIMPPPAGFLNAGFMPRVPSSFTPGMTGLLGR